ncbi:MAG: hypothetical protein IAF58_07110 [Leptolyngbya sp.]|nr:hypothetical protein [Candidatus Melainabacteria bacterium]
MTQNTLETQNKRLDAPPDNPSEVAPNELGRQAERLLREEPPTAKKNGEQSLGPNATLECTNCSPESIGAQRVLPTESSAENPAVKSAKGDKGIAARFQLGVQLGADSISKENPLPAGGTVRPSDRLQTGDRKAVGDALKDGSDRPKELTKAGVIADYSSTLRQAGMSEAEATRISENTYKRLSKEASENHLKGSPEQQMQRANDAYKEVLKGVDGKLEDGQIDHLTKGDRRNLVKDAASRLENPDKFVNQGAHMTCALESLKKQHLEAGDPALVAERLASVVNKGYATIKEDGPNGKERKVHVRSDSFMPDAESKQEFNAAYHGDAGKRGMAGHVWDALSGQTAADLKAEREGKPTSKNGIDKAEYFYMAAHASDVGGRSSQTSTGEGLFRNGPNGQKSLIADNPNVGLWDVAHLNKAMGGKDGAVFASSTLLSNGDKAPSGYPSDLKITAFTGTADLHKKLTQFQERTGQSGQIGVNAPFLPGGGENGHGMHAMNIRANKDGTFKLDNNWGSKQDLSSVGADAVDKATNADRWSSGGRGVPNDGTIFGPGSGRNPNETEADFSKRKDEESKRKDERKVKEEEEKEKEKEREKENRRKQEELKAKAERDLAEAKRLEKEIADLRKTEKETAQRISEMVTKRKDARQAEQLAMGLGHTSKWNHNS